MKDPKGLLTREVARILPRHPNIAVDPRLIEKLIEKDNVVDIFSMPPLNDIITNALVVPYGRERMLIVGPPDFVRVAVLAAADEINPYADLQSLYRFVGDTLANFKSYGHDDRTIAKLRALERAIDIQHADKFRQFNPILLNQHNANAAKAAVVREKRRAEQRAVIEASGEELTSHDANGDRERLVMFDEFEKRAMIVIATAFRAIYGGKDLAATIGHHRLIVKPAPTSTLDVITAARRILNAP